MQNNLFERREGNPRTIDSEVICRMIMKGMYLIKHNDGRTEYLTHEFYFSMNTKTKRNKLSPLRESYRRKQLEVFCSCNKPYAKMSIGHLKEHDTFYISSFDRKAHHIDCYYYSEENEKSLSPQSIYQKGFTENKDGTFEIQFDSQDYQTHKEVNDAAMPQVNNNEVTIRKNSAGGVATNKPSVFATMERIVTEAWNNSMKFRHSKGYPKNDVTTVYNQIADFVTKKYTHKEIGFNNYLYKGVHVRRIYSIKDELKKRYNINSAAFTILLFQGEKVVQNGDMYRISLRNPNSEQLRELDVPNVLFEQALSAVNMPGPYFAGGFVESTGYNGTPRFISFGLVAINEYGVPVESSYERQLYDQLCYEQRVVLRPMTNDRPEWNGFLPDGLLIDTTPPTIIEVFGMSENMVSYHEQRGIKIGLFSSLKPKYDFWYWDAFNQKEIPPLS